MCKPVIMVLVALVLVTSSFTILSAQTPFVAVYFETVNWSESATCPDAPPGTVAQELFIAALNFNATINAIEFQVNYPPELQFLGDTYPHVGVPFGNTATGLQYGFTFPPDGNSAIIVAVATVIWQCRNCQGGVRNVPITVGPNPLTGLLRALVLGDPDVEIPGVGLTALICANVPVEETTWGGIKALYSE